MTVIADLLLLLRLEPLNLVDRALLLELSEADINPGDEPVDLFGRPTEADKRSFVREPLTVGRGQAILGR